MYKTLLFILFSLKILSGEAQLNCGQDIDLNSWTQQGDPTAGAWVVSPGGNSVTQTVNCLSTWFVSDVDFFNVLIEGSIQVNTSADDDIIGFAFGYQAPFGVLTNPNSTYMKTFLFDWKQETQNFLGLNCTEGFALYEVDGNFNFNNTAGTDCLNGIVYPPLWQRINSPITSVLGTNYNNNGWVDFQQYDFRLKYTADSIVIWIDDVRIFEEGGCFEPGRFGFYNQSQSDVIYSNFSYEFEYDFSVQNPTICQGEQGIFEVGSGCSNYFPPSTTFDWDFGDGSTGSGTLTSHLYNTPGIYNVELVATDILGCTDTTIRSIEVLQSSSPDAGSNQTVCALGTILNASNTGVGSWSGPAGVIFSNPSNPTTQVTVPSTGSYNLIWTDVNFPGCGGADTVNVIFQGLTLSSVIEQPDCFGDQDGEVLVTLSGGSQPYTYYWNNSSIPGSNSLTGLGAGNYSLSVSDNSGCVMDTTFILQDPTALIVQASPDMSLCSGSGTTISATATGGTPGYTYNWSGFGNGQTQNVSPSVTSTYTVTVTDQNGCTATDDLQIEIIQPTDVAFSVDTTVSCSEPAIEMTFTNITPQSGNIPIWDFGDGSSGSGDVVTYSYSSPGTYDVTMTIVDANGCSSSMTQTNLINILEGPNALFGMNPSVTTVDNTTVQFNDASTGDIVSWFWDFGGLDSSYIENPNYTFPETTAFYPVTLTVTDNYGCSDEITYWLEVISDISIFIPNTFTPNGNEYNQDWEFFINGIDTYSFHLEIYNRWGEVIWDTNDINSVWDGTYKGNMVQDGTYTWKLTIGDYNNGNMYEHHGHVNVVR